MTLFRKVFQNQARPADAGDALDETALQVVLRDAGTTDDDEKPDPFVLSDRVDPSRDDAGGSDKVGDEAEVSAETEMTGLGEDTEPAQDEQKDRSETTASEELVDEDEFVACEDEESGNELVEGILAAAQRETACYEPNIPPAGEGSQQDGDLADASGDFGEGPENSTENDAGDTVKEEFVPTSGPDLPAEIETPAVQTSDDAAQEDPKAATAPDQAGSEPEQEANIAQPSAVPEEELDLSAFARGQLNALGGRSHADTGNAEAADTSPAMPAPAAGRAGRRAGRVKTRLLGFNRGSADHADPIGVAVEATASQQQEKFPVGWLVVTEGPGIGHSFSIFTGASMIGRGEDQVIRLDFGDNSISRQNHAAIAYDEEQNKFYIGHGGKSNIIRRNARPVLSTEELQHADLIRIGETTLRFVALCGSDFKWDAVDTDNDAAV